MDKIIKDAVLEAIKGSDGIVSTIASKLGVDWHIANRHVTEWDETIRSNRNEEERVLDVAEEALFKAVRAGEPWAIKFILATKGKDRGYFEQQSSPEQKSSPIRLLIRIDPAELTDEELYVFKLDRSMPPEVINIEL